MEIVIATDNMACMGSTRNYVSPPCGSYKRYLLLTIILIVSMGFVLSTNCAFAEESALSGLGEPAAPESLAHPERLFPDQSNQGINNDTGADGLINAPMKTVPLTNTQQRQSKPLSKGVSPPSQYASDRQPALGKDSNASAGKPVMLQQSITKNEPTGAFTLKSAVEFAQAHYPVIFKGQAQVNAAQKNVTVQKLNEYLPESLIQYQEIMASHNKLSEVFFGSPVFPAMTGPGYPNVNMEPDFYSGAGFSVDWAPIDFGLHKARIQMAKSMYSQTARQFDATELDVGIATASAFLDSVISAEQIKAAEQNVSSFGQFSEVVRALVTAQLRPGADASLAEAQLANAQNDLIRAQMNREITIAGLANTLGLGGRLVDIDQRGLVTYDEPAQIQRSAPVFENVPILKTSNAAILTAVAQKKILDKEYYPVFHFLGGVSTRGAGLNTQARPQSANVNGVFPVVPNYQIAMIINWNFLDIFRLREEKKVQVQRIIQSQQDYELILQSLKTQDIQSRVRVKAAIALAANMPVQVRAARIATRQAEARYKAGLGTVAQVAEALQMLAQSRVQEAIVKVGVWRALLSVAAAHGDLKPFLAEAQRVQRGL